MRRRSTIALVLGLVCLTLYLPAAIRTPFFTRGEPREALVVQRMVEHGDWILPRRPSETGLVTDLATATKPPLFHWLGAVTSLAAGTISEWTVRLPSVALGTATVILVCLLGATILPTNAALTGAVVLATTLQWVRGAVSARVDMTLAACTAIALLLLYRGFVRRGLGRGEAIVAYGCLAGAVLAKGPVGVVLPALVLLVALLAQGEMRRLPTFRPALGIAIVLVVAGGWYLAAWYLGGQAFLEQHLLGENLTRITGGDWAGRSSHFEPFYYYGPVLAAGFLPWTPFLLAALITSLRSPSARRDPRIAFLLAWVGVFFVCYSLASGKQPAYLLALYPGAALLTGWWWSCLLGGEIGASWLRGRPARILVMLLTSSATLALLIQLAEVGGLDPLSVLGPVLSPRDRANLPLVQEALATNAVTVGTLLALLVGAAIAVRRALRHAHWPAAFAALSGVAFLMWSLAFTSVQPQLARRRTLEPFLRQVVATVGNDALYCHPETFDYGMAYYLRGRVQEWPRLATSAPGTHYILLWDSVLADLSASERAGLAVLATSDGTDTKGRRHLVLVRATGHG